MINGIFQNLKRQRIKYLKLGQMERKKEENSACMTCVTFIDKTLHYVKDTSLRIEIWKRITNILSKHQFEEFCFKNIEKNKPVYNRCLIHYVARLKNLI